MTNARKALSREHEKYADLKAAKEKVDLKLHQAEKDYELSVTSSTRLSEMNKELQKSLMFSNEKYYSLERQKAALEFEAASLKDSANNDNEGLTSAVDFLRKEITEIETKLEASIEELKLARLDKIEVETALNGEILARDKVCICTYVCMYVCMHVCMIFVYGFGASCGWLLYFLIRYQFS